MDKHLPNWCSDHQACSGGGSGGSNNGGGSSTSFCDDLKSRRPALAELAAHELDSEV